LSEATSPHQPASVYSHTPRALENACSFFSALVSRFGVAEAGGMFAWVKCCTPLGDVS